MASEQAERAVSMMRNRAILSPEHFYHGLSDAIDEAADLPRLMRVEKAAREFVRDDISHGDKLESLFDLKAALSEEAKT